MKNHINVLELLAIKLAKQIFSKTWKYKAIHLQVDNMVALTYLLKMRGTQNLKLFQLAKKHGIIFSKVGSLLLQSTFSANWMQQ